jgi:hypothetical protein
MELLLTSLFLLSFSFSFSYAISDYFLGRCWTNVEPEAAFNRTPPLVQVKGPSQGNKVFSKLAPEPLL